MNKKLIGIVIAVMLGVILIESYFLLVQSNHTGSEVENTTDATSQTPANETSTELSNGTNNVIPNFFSPSVPEFTVELVDSSYDVPTTYSTDPYTGKRITHEGYHVERRTMEVRIKNQPFTPYTDSDGRNIKFFYNIRTKGHFTEEWSEVYNAGEMPTQSNSEYTVISYDSERTYTFTLGTTSRCLEVSPGGQVDFQVQALVGYTQDTITGPAFHGWVFTGEKSGWSETIPLTIP